MYTVIDTHCDTASVLLDKNEKLTKTHCMINLSDMERFNSYVQFFAAYVSKEYKNPMLRAVEILTTAKEEIKENNIKLILNSNDLDEVIKNGKKGAVLAIEDARALCGKVASLDFFYDYGVRAMTLAWNDDNEVTDGADSKNNTGLTTFGREVVRKMNKLGMIVDVSHISEKGFYDVLNITDKPVMASHSNCYTVCNHRRNLKDEQIRAIIKNNGIMCINIYPPFLSQEPEKANIDSVISHIDYALSLGAENHLGLGSDFDGIDQTPKGIRNLKDYEKMFEKMVKIGYNIDLINKLTHKNVQTFMRRV